VLPTRKTAKTGRYNILVHSKTFKKVRATIIDKFPAYYDQIASDAQQNPDAYLFLGPPSIPNYNNNNEDASSGDQSFLSMSAASFASFGDMSATADVYEPFTPATNPYSWADIAKRSQSSIPDVVSTPTSSADVTMASQATSVLTASEVQTATAHEIQNLRAEYEHKISSNNKEIGQLKDMLNQVLLTLQSLGVQGVPALPTSPLTDPDYPPLSPDPNSRQLK
jgi:hypothetical protein